MMLAACTPGCTNKPESVLDYPGTNNNAVENTALPSAPAAAIANKGWVTDEAGILPPGRAAALATRLAAFERHSGHQFVVVTAASLGGQDVAAFTAALANAWGVGAKGRDDGVVLLVAPKERKARIAVGRGLRDSLSDAECARILQETILPHMREGDLAGGIDAGVTAILARIGG